MCPRATIIVLKSNKYYLFWVCVRSLKYPVCNAHTPYYHLWPVRLYSIYPIYSYYLINGLFFARKLLNIQYMFWYYIQLLSEIFLILRRIKRGLYVNCPLFLSYFNETWIFSTDFRKILKYPTSWKPLPVGAQLFHAGGRTDGQRDMTKL